MTAAPFRLETPDGAQEFALSRADTARPLTEVLARRGFPLNTRCGGRGLCGGCEVGLVAGELRRRADGAPVGPATPGPLRACQLQAGGGPATLALPARSLLRHRPSVVAEFRLNIPWGCDPLGPGARYGAAVDIGTTTVALLLCDLATGRVLADVSGFNAQIRFGEDVVTRIQACSADPAAVAALQRAVAADTVQPLLAEACAKTGVALRDVGVMSVAGNTTMLHLLCGVDPTPLGVHPFRPAFTGHRQLRPEETGLTFGDGTAEVHLLPGPAAYVGADLAAGMVATGLVHDEGPVVLVDVGTNGEIIAAASGRLLGCATAAGPAFEGAGLASGSRAVEGAIERIRLRGDPFGAELGVIGDAPHPLGLCGSAYVDFLWEARRLDLLLPTGRFAPGFAALAGEALQADRFGRRLQLHPRGASGPIVVSEHDIARLLQAKAAIAAGIHTVLGLLGVEPRHVRRLYLAGGFGLHLSLDHAIGCGLLPGFVPAQIQVVGNTALGGAFLALNDRSLLAEMTEACGRLEEVELNLQPGFEDAYIDQLALP